MVAADVKLGRRDPIGDPATDGGSELLGPSVSLDMLSRRWRGESVCESVPATSGVTFVEICKGAASGRGSGSSFFSSPSSSSSSEWNGDESCGSGVVVTDRSEAERAASIDFVRARASVAGIVRGGGWLSGGPFGTQWPVGGGGEGDWEMDGEPTIVEDVMARGEEAMGEVETDVMLGERLTLGEGWKMEVNERGGVPPVGVPVAWRTCSRRASSRLGDDKGVTVRD